jgi:ketosteroid isomerase-like protein
MTDHERIAQRAIEAWNTHDVERVLSCYTDDLVYKDPNTNGEVLGAAAFGRYLGKMFSLWEMHWKVERVFPFRETEGAAALWSATLRPRSGGEPIPVQGMDLTFVRESRLSRNEVYFDRLAIAGLLGAR